jgi:coenzyme F420-reducing hydrogenase beta subunit
MNGNIHKINILDSSAIRACTGCGACSLICPFDAINMDYDQNGFYRPSIDTERCTMCGLCPTVCYKFNRFACDAPFSHADVIAVTNNYIDDMNSVTTAGVATRLADYFYEMGYNVCGVRYDYDTDVSQHDIATSWGDVLEFTGSKYMPSKTSMAFKKILKENKPLIVFGLPCQMHGLRKVIEEKNITAKCILVDFFCAGVLSKNVWDKHLEFLRRKYSIGKIKHVNFKDKTQGWRKSSLKVIDTRGREYRQNRFNDMFYAFILRRIPYQKSCYSCAFRKEIVSSDIRLGDFWGSKFMAWDDGVELMALMNDKARSAWDSIKDSFSYKKCSQQDLYDSQETGAMKMNVEIPEDYDRILDALHSERRMEDIFRDLHIAQRPIGG